MSGTDDTKGIEDYLLSHSTIRTNIGRWSLRISPRIGLHSAMMGNSMRFLLQVASQMRLFTIAYYVEDWGI